ncbi:MAG: hypothetical protein Q3M30_11120 [Candidatus Electrothrix sp. Rat3]|nr:hypothetical protein [Candidatus Electrothrix rattekaaiensis]
MSLFDLDILFLRSLFSHWYPFSIDQIKKYRNTIDWDKLRCNPNFDPVLKKDRYIDGLSDLNMMLPFDDIKWYASKNDPERSWITISANSDIEWSTAFIREYADKLKWEDTIIIEVDHISYDIHRYGGICSNPSVKIDQNFIHEFSHKISWQSLSWNQGADWSIELIKEFEDEWMWSWNDADFYGEDVFQFLIPEYASEDDYSYNLTETNFSANYALPWSEEFLEEFKQFLDWSIISRAYYIPWSIPLLTKFFPLWDKEGLISNFALWEKVFRLPVSENEKIIETVFTP